MTQAYKHTLKGILKFELIGFIGRNFLHRTPTFQDDNLYLNLGCGGNFQQITGGGA